MHESRHENAMIVFPFNEEVDGFTVGMDSAHHQLPIAVG
jgi:hypothetical protein